MALPAADPRSSEGIARASRPARGAVNVRREAIYTWIGLALTIATSIMVHLDIQALMRSRLHVGAWVQLAADVVLMMSVYYLIFGTVLYFACRLAYLKRLAVHRPSSHAELEAVYDQPRAPVLTILVPSYKEEEPVVRQTLLSAALMEYPDRDIVLLIDDPPEPVNSEAADALARMRNLPRQLEDLFRKQQRRYSTALADFERRCAQGAVHLGRESQRVAELYREVAAGLERQARTSLTTDHTDRLFVQ